jgi:hypothetical protein
MKTQEWVRVEDGLPPRLKDVLVWKFYDIPPEVGESHWGMSVDFTLMVGGKLEFATTGASHWMPLPEPPEVEDEV